MTQVAPFLPDKSLHHYCLEVSHAVSISCAWVRGKLLTLKRRYKEKCRSGILRGERKMSTVVSPQVPCSSCHSAPPLGRESAGKCAVSSPTWVICLSHARDGLH